MKQRKKTGGSRWKRISACILSAAMLMGTTPWLPAPEAQAASYQQPYLDKMVAWGFMRGDLDGNLNPDNPITRAEYVSIINRALGYEEMGGTPFRDVQPSDWFAEDVDIAYTEGYVAGTSKNTFSPYDPIDREQAVVMLARNLMLQPAVGENVDFTDSRELSDWSRGLISTAMDYQLIDGYPDGTFRPKNAITRGEAAILITNAVGTPIQDEGEYTLGHTWGNVTITSSGVTLKDTVVAGNLYITDGVDLGYVTLENVTVLGEILVSGGGVSESGDDSIILRNVTAPKLILDNIDNQQISVRVQGDSNITTASIRADAYVTDDTGAGKGISRIELDGEDGLKMTLAGNVKEVVNYTPESTINVASGQVDTITVDEKAVDSTLNIVSGAEVDHVKLDVGTIVTGEGDIGELIVNAPGSTVSMLPDQIIIRPGISANINGEDMDSEAAAEASADPRLQAGYPRITDLAPTSASAQFKANKKGTVYWAITAVTDGSVGAEDLIYPSSYTPKIVQQGTVSLTDSSQVETAKINKLTSNGSYYLSSVFVDGRDDRSPLKVISFTTPDDTKPDFASGYPYMSKITSISGQVTAMTTKTCRLYYAVLPKGSAAPTAEDFKSNAVTGNLGFGTLDVTKNTPYTFEVNNVPLEELETYDLYLWLTDVDGAQSSSVKKLTFTTVDGTPPIFNTEPTVNSVKETSVGLYANLNEAGTLYWVVVNQGETYPKPLAGQSGAVDLSSEEAKMQVMAGMNALKSGKVNMIQDSDVSFNVSGLEPEKAYDLYYVAQDKAGNFSDRVGKITIHTLDPNAPTVTQEFTKYNGTDTTTPLADTDIRLVFSEAVQTVSTNTPLVDLYQAVTDAIGTAGEATARETMAAALRSSIYLYNVPSGSQPERVIDGAYVDKNTEDWVIDYRYAVIKLEEGKTVVTFPNGQGLNLRSGAEYYFEIQADSLSDTSSAMNVMGRTKLDNFRTVFAQVNLSALNENQITSYTDTSGGTQTPSTAIPVDVSWRLSPVSTEKVDDSIDWDMLIWCDTSVEFQLYYREIGGNSTWKLLNDKSASITVPDGVTGYRGISLTRLIQNTNNPDFDALNTLEEDVKYEYAISFTKVAGLPARDTWTQRLNMRIHVVAGSNNDLAFLTGDITEENWEDSLKTGVTNIGLPDDFTLRKQFTDQQAPEFSGDYPMFEVGDSAVNMSLMLDRPGTVYYVIAPLGYIGTMDEEDREYKKDGADGEDNWELYLPESGEEGQKDPPTLVTPEYLNIVNAQSNYRNPKIKYGSVNCGSSVEEELVDGLDAETKYIAYFVLQGTAQTYSRVLAYRFLTTQVDKPAIGLNADPPSVNFEITNDKTAELTYALVPNNELPNNPIDWKGKNGFDAYVDSALKAEYDQAWNNPSNGTDQLDRSIIWALSTKNNLTGYSVFDDFANASIRQTVENYISGNNGQGSNVVARGGKQLTEGNNYTDSQDFTNNMTDGTIYYCLAMAYNPLGSAISFAAVNGVYIPDRTPPQLLGVETSLTWSNPDKNTYSGTVTFRFSEPVYQLVSQNGIDQEPKVVWQANDTTPPPNQDPNVNVNPVLLKEIMGTSFSKDAFSYPNEIKHEASTLTLEFKLIPIGTTIVLFDNSFICDASSNSTRQNLAFALQKTQIGVIGGSEEVKFVQLENTN